MLCIAQKEPITEVITACHLRQFEIKQISWPFEKKKKKVEGPYLVTVNTQRTRYVFANLQINNFASQLVRLGPLCLDGAQKKP